MRAKLILVVILVLIFLFWRGLKQVSAEKGINCQFRFGYAVCSTNNGKSAELPRFFEIIKAGAKF